MNNNTHTHTHTQNTYTYFTYTFERRKHMHTHTQKIIHLQNTIPEVNAKFEVHIILYYTLHISTYTDKYALKTHTYAYLLLTT